MHLSDLWYLHRERAVVIAVVLVLGTAVTIAFVAFGGGQTAKQASCAPGADPIEALASNDFQRLSPRQALRVNPRLEELERGSWPVVYWWRGGSENGVYVSVLVGAWHGFNGDMRYDITSAAYGPGTVVEPAHISNYKGYEQWVPRKPGHTVAFETRCDQVGFYGRTEAEAKQAAEDLLPLIDPGVALEQPAGSLRT